jgi:two-component system response regulator YesN
MTYQILLVDDEPIILSGIKFLIDWEKNDCNIIGIARNGQQALEAIEELQPHIVICDINMPVMSGIDVLKESSERSSLPIFIMLTNYGEFDLARESLRYRAVDYLLKSQLEAESLEKSLMLAKQEYERQRSLIKVDIANNYIRINKSQIIAQHLKKIMDAKNVLPDNYIKHLDAEKVFHHYCFIHIFMDFTSLPSSDALSEEETSQLFAWEQELVEKLSGNIFPNYTVFDPEDYKQSLLIFCWNLPDNAEAMIGQFYSKLCNASDNITQIHLSLAATKRFEGAGHITDAIMQLHRLCEYYYNFQYDYIFFHQLPDFETLPLSFTEIINKIIPSLRTKNVEQCSFFIGQASCIISDTTCQRQAAVKECTSLYTTVSSILAPMLPSHQTNDYFTNNTSIIHQIACLSSKKAVKAWLSRFNIQVQRQLEQLNASKSDLAEKARNYVIKNVEKRIMLQDVADYVNLSPNYLSALFKKEYQQNFVEFINETKMEWACTLIREGKYRIYEVSYMLGFDNAYYFTKVFKKYTGLTPTEYQRNVRPSSHNR